MTTFWRIDGGGSGGCDGWDVELATVGSRPMDYYSAHVWNRRITAAKAVRCFLSLWRLRWWCTCVSSDHRCDEQARRTGRQRSTLPLSIATAKKKKKKNPTILQAFFWNCFPRGEPGGGVFFGGGSIIFGLAFVMRVKKMKIRYSESSSSLAMWPSFGFRPVLLLDAF